MAASDSQSVSQPTNRSIVTLPSAAAAAAAAGRREENQQNVCSKSLLSAAATARIERKTEVS